MVLRPAKEPDTLSKNTNKNKFFKWPKSERTQDNWDEDKAEFGVKPKTYDSNMDQVIEPLLGKL
jgi:hypothetical protein